MWLKALRSIIMSCLLSTSTPAFPIKVIYNTIVPYTGEPTLLNIFTCRASQWVDGTNIIVYTYPFDSDIHRSFLRSYLNISDSLYFSLHATYAKAHHKVKVVNSDDEMVMMVGFTPNSIGYVIDQRVINRNKMVTILE